LLLSLHVLVYNSLSLSPVLRLQPGTYSALGYTYHLKGDFNAAIDNYHKVGAGRCCRPLCRSRGTL
jgi:hypothetical protein